MTKWSTQDSVESCNGVIVNVMGGAHWVLLTVSFITYVIESYVKQKGWDSRDDGSFYVNDPGFAKTQYNYADFIYWAVYTYH